MVKSGLRRWTRVLMAGAMLAWIAAPPAGALALASRAGRGLARRGAAAALGPRAARAAAAAAPPPPRARLLATSTSAAREWQPITGTPPAPAAQRAPAPAPSAPPPPGAPPSVEPAARADAWSDTAVEGVTVVRTEAQARRVLAQLMSLTDAYHAIDTETTALDIKKQGPVGNGHVTCLSIYCGPGLDFGNGPCVWVDNWAGGEKSGLLSLFAEYLASPAIRKVLHNLSFDKHVLANEGLRLGGFGADTMHMARLWDSSLTRRAAGAGAGGGAGGKVGRPPAPAAADPAAADDGSAPPGSDEGGGASASEGAAPAGYSLAALTAALLPALAKRPMKELFAVARPKADGSASKVLTLPDPLTLQLAPETRPSFIAYSAHDALATWHLREALGARLAGMPWGKGRSMAEYYEAYIRPFGELLTEMEALGMKVDVGRLPAVRVGAEAALADAEAAFRRWAGAQCAHARWMNPGSSAQLAQLLFAPPAGEGAPPPPLLPPSVVRAAAKPFPPAAALVALGVPRARDCNLPLPAALGLAPTGGGDGAEGGAKGGALPAVRRFKVEVTPDLLGAMEAELRALLSQLHSAWGACHAAHAAHAARAAAGGLGARAAPPSVAGIELDEACAAPPPAAEAFLPAQEAKMLKALRRRRFAEIALTGLGVPAPKRTKGGAPSTSAATLAELVKSGAVRRHLEATRGAEGAAEAEGALQALTEVGALDTMLGTFIHPLGELVDARGRVHSSLNLNTETGRLSSQRPNLQNQPALDKDRFLIRDLFTCEEGNALVVADYGQLELRLLAHMTGCASMREAFELGGDFHSRTAMGMYAHVAAAVQSGDVLLERPSEPSAAEASKPLVKDEFANERKKAKVLNFSIAYGKTAQGLAADWKVSVDEAKATLELWYRDRPEVRAWQQETIEMARRVHYVRTLTGRYRRLPGIASRSAAERRHNERAAINTPVQGTAADVVMCAMLKVDAHPRLRELGWRLVLQVHDELILEGPEGSREEALALVVACMERPFSTPLSVDLVVDAKTDKTWYRAK